MSDAAPPQVAPPTFGDILVVDDNAENLIAIEAALEGLGGGLVRARSGTDALRWLLRRDFALILLDVQMPDLDGYDTAHLIRQRERSRHVPIIFVTGFDRDDVAVRRAYELGAVDFLTKPIRPDILRAKASVFVELQRRTEEIARQAELLREHQRREHERELLAQRRALEAAALRLRLDEQRAHSEALARKAEELAHTAEQRRVAQLELQRINDKLAETDRRKDEFLAVLAHELRNPLAPLVAGMEILEDAASEDELMRSTTGAMQRQIDHLTRLVDDLLDVSRITSGKIELRRQTLDLASLVRHAISLSMPAIESRGHTIDVDLPERAMIIGDDVRLAQVVSNLLNNAARYTEPGGRITLRCEPRGDTVAIIVEDTGCGMTPELLERVFDMFVQERAGRGGLGVGLTLVKNLVEMHGGTVTATSAGPGQGSEIVVQLPLAPDQSDRPPTERLPPETCREACPKLRVVLIEDDPDIRALVGRVLQGWGHQVEDACTGGSGIELVLRTRPDVAFVDIGLPDMEGYDVAVRVREALADACPRLVAMTGFSRDRDRQRAHDAGFDQHLVKPARASELRRALSPVS